MSARDEWYALRDLTPARLALGRSGNALPTSRVLEFQLAHARARDAVHRSFHPEEIAAEFGAVPAICVTTQAGDRLSYLINPALGRELSPTSRARLKRGRYDAVLVIADGLSPTAVHKHGAALGHAIFKALPDLKWAPAVIVTQGRVAIGDEIAKLLGADIAVVMIGERPGLTAADSLGLYLTYAPKSAITQDAERNCISNVRPDGLPLAEAARRLAWLAREARRLRLSGVGLKEDAPETALPPGL
ncbi:MAG: ethanolamine ammonia-lyase subunit EutC [Proteobacteria bacterium]|nr:ethanolamine ammonia-lyase subunit EutC [Pseudomonadota bacterium]